MARVRVVRWGSIDGDEPDIQWGLKVGKAYVCRGQEVPLYPSKAEAHAAARELERRLALQPKSPNHDH